MSLLGLRDNEVPELAAKVDDSDGHAEKAEFMAEGVERVLHRSWGMGIVCVDQRVCPGRLLIP